MNVRGVVFDLFGTLVEDARDEIYPAMAAVLGLTREEFRLGWGKLYTERGTGKMTFAESIVAMGFERSLAEEAAKIRAAEVFRSLGAVMPGAEDLLQALPVPFTLLSNASVEVPAAWPVCRLARFFADPLFSCDIRLMKPDPAFYRLASERLGMKPEECAFVGNGGDDEIAGAAAAGMTAVQLLGGLPLAGEARFVIQSLAEIPEVIGLGARH